MDNSGEDGSGDSAEDTEMVDAVVYDGAGGSADYMQWFWTWDDMVAFQQAMQSSADRGETRGNQAGRQGGMIVAVAQQNRESYLIFSGNDFWRIYNIFTYLIAFNSDSGKLPAQPQHFSYKFRASKW